MTIWTPDLSAFDGPLYLRLASAIEQAIVDGSLPAQTRLPTHRALADKLGVTVGTVTRAYSEAERRGLVAARVGHGTWVKGANTDPANQWVIRTEEGPRIELWQNLPVQLDRAALIRPLLENLSQGDLNQLLGYGKEAGQPDQRQRFIEWLTRQGIAAQEERLLFSHGAQHGIMLAMLATGCVGESLMCEGLSYPGMLGNARQLKNQVIGLAMDEEGLLPDALDAACRSRRARVLYLTPTLQNPTTAIMSLERREAIVAVARRHDLLIIEDDVNGLLPEPHQVPLVNLAPERVIYLGSLAKIACGGMRVGFVLAPDHLKQGFAQAMRLSSWMVSPLLVELACQLVSQPGIDQLIREQRQTLARRGELLHHLLPGARWQPGSMHAWLPLPEPWRSQEFAAAADALDVGVASGEHFAAGQFAAPQGVRLSLSQPATDARVAEGLERLAQLLRGTPPSNPLL
ncbi:aminotransferase-like domain-containing protein [Aeromonas sp. L_1B5_3]|uniref:aminotransferase-like domain-containing protein n=1 Tax=Aeromonas sp. L_1B5_3 TaxID=1588629 RepID=UPI0005B71617|nr:PLP-dependent aminotransferase family protein [Aeromonas sp. L_1B5_3]KIQ83413.1 GntR family transcriptional regulator [Aeromonas sp. L_1B5_3]